MGSHNGGPWSFSPKQATQPFSSPLCSPPMTGLNIRFHLSEMEECWCEWRKVFAGFPTPTDILPTPLPPPAQWAEIISPGGTNVQVRAIFIWVQLASVFSSDKWGCCHPGGGRRKGCTRPAEGFCTLSPPPPPGSVLQVPG